MIVGNTIFLGVINIRYDKKSCMQLTLKIQKQALLILFPMIEEIPISHFFHYHLDEKYLNHEPYRLIYTFTSLYHSRKNFSIKDVVHQCVMDQGDVSEFI